MSRRHVATGVDAAEMRLGTEARWVRERIPGSIMRRRERTDEAPEEFRRAADGMLHVQVRPEVRLERMPAPRRLAPYTAALSAAVRRGDAELASGRFVLLHDPDGQPGWEGTFRVVVYVRADLDPEMAGDPLLPPVGWSWLTEALETRGAEHRAAGGTVTRVTSESFGEMVAEPSTSEVELRASWTPVDEDIGRHVEAWCDVCTAAAGLPPAPPGVAALPSRRDPHAR